MRQLRDHTLSSTRVCHAFILSAVSTHWRLVEGQENDARVNHRLQRWRWCLRRSSLTAQPDQRATVTFFRVSLLVMRRAW
jgi:hypothetical protein